MNRVEEEATEATARRSPFGEVGFHRFGDLGSHRSRPQNDRRSGGEARAAQLHAHVRLIARLHNTDVLDDSGPGVRSNPEARSKWILELEQQDQ
jgi:hypothetical protein